MSDKTVESLINFEVGQTVIYNPDNHGFLHIGAYLKVAERKGKVVRVEQIGGYDKDWKPTYAKTGRITVEWDGVFETRIVNYKRLKIVG